MEVAVIGAGRMGRRHVRASQELGLDLVGVADVSREALETVAQECGLAAAQLFTDTAELLERTKPECVIVATTADTHAEYTCLAAKRKARYVLCEKPMAVSLDQCDRMVDECASRGVALGINHPRRFLPQFVDVDRVVHSEEFGTLRSMTVIGGNMGLAMNGCHYIEFFRYLTGEDPAEVSAWLGYDGPPNPRGERFVDPAGSIRLVTTGGARLYIDIGARQGHGIFVTYAGTRGLMMVDELAGIARLSVRDAAHRDAPTNRYGLPPVEQEWQLPRGDPAALSREMLRELITGSENIPTGIDGRRTIEVLVAAYQSHDAGHLPISFDKPMPRDRVFPWA
jgi:predicted dehydrogenase